MNISDRFDDTGENMTIYEAIRYLYSIADNAHPFRVPQEEVRALNMCRDFADAFDALAPTPEMWAKYPWAQWITMFDNGRIVYWEYEPETRIMPAGEYAWIEQGGLIGMTRAEQVGPLPPNIDWRDCKWKRPETSA